MKTYIITLYCNINNTCCITLKNINKNILDLDSSNLKILTIKGIYTKYSKKEVYILIKILIVMTKALGRVCTFPYHKCVCGYNLAKCRGEYY